MKYNFSSRNKTNKQGNLLTLTVSCEKSCLIRRKKKVKTKWINNNKEINLNLNKTLVRFVRHWRIQALHNKQLKKKINTQNKTMGYITPAMGYYPRNG